MSSLIEFNNAVKIVNNLGQNILNDNEKLGLYGLFKQAEYGDNNNNSKPSGLFNLKEKAKWDAWNYRKGMSQEEARFSYIKAVNFIVKSRT